MRNRKRDDATILVFVVTQGRRCSAASVIGGGGTGAQDARPGAGWGARLGRAKGSKESGSLDGACRDGPRAGRNRVRWMRGGSWGQGGAVVVDDVFITGEVA